MLYKKGVLNNLTKVTGQHLCGSLFFNNLAVNFAKLFKTHLLHNTSEQLLLCVYHVQLKVLATLLLYNAAWKVSYSEFFWSVFSHIWTEYEEIRSISPYSVWMREITYQKNPYADTFYVVRKVTMENQFWRTSILQNLEFVKFILVSDAQRILFVQLISRHTVQWSSVNFFSLVLKLPS